MRIKIVVDLCIIIISTTVEWIDVGNLRSVIIKCRWFSSICAVRGRNGNWEYFSSRELLYLCREEQSSNKDTPRGAAKGEQPLF